jgi:translation initiation factor IF-1
MSTLEKTKELIVKPGDKLLVEIVEFNEEKVQNQLL